MNQANEFIEKFKAEKSLRVDYESMENYITVKNDIDGVRLEFILNYLTEYTNYVAPTYEFPEDFDIEYTPVEFHDIALYENDKEIELTQFQLNELDKIIYKKLEL